jgi:hypothetical protein
MRMVELPSRHFCFHRRLCHRKDVEQSVGVVFVESSLKVESVAGRERRAEQEDGKEDTCAVNVEYGRYRGGVRTVAVV